MSRLLKYQPGDCQTHVFVKIDDRGKEQWFRYCFTHDDGSNKYGKHPRGHTTEAAARMSEYDHVMQMRKNRSAYEKALEWAHRLVAAADWDTFISIYSERYDSIEPYPEREGSREAMLNTQRVYRESVIPRYQEKLRLFS